MSASTSINITIQNVHTDMYNDVSYDASKINALGLYYDDLIIDINVRLAITGIPRDAQRTQYIIDLLISLAQQLSLTNSVGTVLIKQTKERFAKRVNIARPRDVDKKLAALNIYIRPAIAPWNTPRICVVYV